MVVGAAAVDEEAVSRGAVHAGAHYHRYRYQYPTTRGDGRLLMVMVGYSWWW